MNWCRTSQGFIGGLSGIVVMCTEMGHHETHIVSRNLTVTCVSFDAKCESSWYVQIVCSDRSFLRDDARATTDPLLFLMFAQLL